MKKQILIADDHAIIRKGVKKLIDDTEDLEVGAEASNGHQVLEQVRLKAWDAALLDLSMPGRNGLELIKLVRQESPQTAILIFSMHPEEQYAVRAIRAGASGYLSKESDSDLLIVALRKVASGGMYINPKVAELLATDVSPLNSDHPHTLLTDREFEVFSRIVKGLRISDIAEELKLSIKTVSTHKSHIMEKLSVDNNVDLLRYAMDHGLLDQTPE